MFSCVRLLTTPWTVSRQAPLSVRFSRQEYWSGLPFPPPGGPPDPGIEPISLVSPGLAGRFLSAAPPGKPCESDSDRYLLGLPDRHLCGTCRFPVRPAPGLLPPSKQNRRHADFLGRLGSFSLSLSHLAFYINADFENKIL